MSTSASSPWSTSQFTACSTLLVPVAVQRAHRPVAREAHCLQLRQPLGADLRLDLSSAQHPPA